MSMQSRSYETKSFTIITNKRNSCVCVFNDKCAIKAVQSPSDLLDKQLVKILPFDSSTQLLRASLIVFTDHLM